ncbi:four helix bundle protein [bacterium]|nr:four helix bundle protein [bacterium]
MKEITSLDVYNLSEKLSDDIWHLYDTWNKKAQNTLGLQIIRSADSISANLAEGYGRYSFADRKRFYMYSRGSFEETKAWLRKAHRRNLLTDETSELLQEIIQELGPKLNAFINSPRPH